MILTIKYAEERKVDVDKTIQKLDAKNHKNILLGIMILRMTVLL